MVFIWNSSKSFAIFKNKTPLWVSFAL